MKTSLIFFGNEKLATGIPEAPPIIREAVLDAGYRVEAVITGPLKTLPNHHSQLGVLAAYGRILPQSVLDQFQLGIINVHPSLLPIYRGPTPIEQAILDGATKTGVSIMRLTREMDEGPLYKQKSLKLSGNESKAELSSQLQQLGAELLLAVLPGIINGSLKPRRQPHPDRDTSYTKLIQKNDGTIDWTKPAKQLAREVRAYLGWPGSFTELGGQPVIITSVRTSVDSGSVGQAYKTANGELAVYCGQGSLIIDRLKPAGKRVMTGREWLAGHQV